MIKRVENLGMLRKAWLPLTLAATRTSWGFHEGL